MSSWRPWRRKTVDGRGAGARSTPPAPALDKRQGLWLLSSAAVSAAPHAMWLPGWISVVCALLLTWRGLLLWQGSRPPPRALLLVITLALAVGVRIEFDHFFGKDPGVALLALLLGLKLLETQAARDIRAGVLLCLFLQLAIFFEDQSLPVAALALCGTLLALGALIALVDPAARLGAQLRGALSLLAQGLPFMLALFLLFPRIQGPLWGLPADAFSARTGLSDTMTPGSISALGTSSAIAFRVRFEGTPPAQNQRYWRGPVLTAYDGRTWRARPARESDTPFYTPSGARIDYALTLEPHNQRWLLALDYPGEAQPKARYSHDFLALSPRPVQTRTRFTLSAYPSTPTGLAEDAATLAAATRLPPGSNPRSAALAAELAAGTRSHAETLARVIAHLRATPLRYTLQPPLLGSHPADDFLFETQSGFCEHFASAFVVLMRAAGVPARVVTGYQGGEINPVDGYLVVRQSDAHAWAEVWLAGRGWVRVDPTALAAPERIDDGMASALAADSALPLLLRADMRWLRDLRHQWEAVSNAWNQHVLGYNPERQRELLERLGLSGRGIAALVALLAAAVLAIFLALFAWATWRRRPRDPLQKAWARFCRKLGRAGLARARWEGPADYGNRIAAALPDQAQALREICATYARLRYGPPCAASALRALNKRIDGIRLQ